MVAQSASVDLPGAFAAADAVVSAAQAAPRSAFTLLAVEVGFFTREF
jgi:hypothetical protein